MNYTLNRIEVEQNESKSHPIVVQFKILEIQKKAAGCCPSLPMPATAKDRKGGPMNWICHLNITFLFKYIIIFKTTLKFIYTKASSKRKIPLVFDRINKRKRINNLSIDKE